MFQRGRRWQEFERGRAEADALIYETIDERRADGGDDERDDVLGMLLSARHEDGSPMSPAELRDELMTLLVAGHETTASELAWAFERLAAPRRPRPAHDEIDSATATRTSRPPCTRRSAAGRCSRTRRRGS